MVDLLVLFLPLADLIMCQLADSSGRSSSRVPTLGSRASSRQCRTDIPKSDNAPTRHPSQVFVLDVFKDAGDVAPHRQSDTSPVLERLCLEKV